MGNCRDRLSYLPGVVGRQLLFRRAAEWRAVDVHVKIEGRTDKSEVEVQMLAVGADFFTTMRIPMVVGRALEPTDMASVHEVAVVNRAFVKELIENRELRLHFGHADSRDPQYESWHIGDTRYDDLVGAGTDAFHSAEKQRGTLAVRTVSNPVALCVRAARSGASWTATYPCSTSDAERANRKIAFQ